MILFASCCRRWRIGQPFYGRLLVVAGRCLRCLQLLARQVVVVMRQSIRQYRLKVDCLLVTSVRNNGLLATNWVWFYVVGFVRQSIRQYRLRWLFVGHQRP